MKKRVNFRARVMKYAWQILKATGKAWRECMLRAWQLYRFSQILKSGVVAFSYFKTDGSIRNAYGTLSDIPENILHGGKRMTKPSYKTFSYFDVEKNAFRCFRIENLISVF